MSFSYFLDNGHNDLTRVRMALGDTDASAPKFQDEEIRATITDQGDDWRAAALVLVDSLIARLSQPNFRADWLQVDHASARAGYVTLRAHLARQFGQGRFSLVGGAVHTYRPDSRQTEAPDYDDPPVERWPYDPA
jgi:hypothetical protein